MTNVIALPKRGKTNLEKLQEIVEQWQYQKIAGKVVDAFSASAILAVYNGLNEKNKETYGAVINSDIAKAARIAFKLLK